MRKLAIEPADHAHAVTDLYGVAHGQESILLVDVAPPEGQDLTLSHAGRDAEQHQRLQSGALEGS